MSRFDQLIGTARQEVATLDIDLVAKEVILVPSSGREMRLTREQAHTLALGLIKSKAILDNLDAQRGQPYT